ncbi:ABC transporter substrate-binding protein [Microbacterium aquimaris]|uniref:ABC transporter substrate-binding protein n=1 Tax=Microbacterium aquimaris TaxID=459816 RepID=A0ABU5N422_9MICO|nr:ABC transporter substrate-binding protein [Microbacterium aquimaris]MDZ8160816.1 ABC transporter substrate-binding protein [Microbacterium aquimaris]
MPAIVAASALVLAGCSSPGGDAGPTKITFLTWTDDLAVQQAESMIDAFEEENPDIEIVLDTYPAGAEGDNIVKTRLATGEMSDVFLYNSGALMQALNPDSTLYSLADEPWMAEVADDFQAAVATDQGVYGAPTGTAQAGGIIYSKKVYDELGLSVPESWGDFMANNEKIKEAGITPVFQSYADTWTAQMIVLGSFANVTAVDPDWAEEFTAGKRKYADEPAFAGFEHLQELADAGLFNEDYASATYNEAVGALVEGTAAQYPLLTNAMIRNVRQNYPDAIDDLGIFPIPADDPADTRLTMWQPNALYVPASTEGEKRDAALAFVEFFNSPAGCEIQNESEPGGPYVISSCELPEDVAPIVTDVEQWFDEGKTGLSIGFLSPVKGPNLENILVEVGSGISSAQQGAEAYDADVKKQAQQLGLPGW